MEAGDPREVFGWFEGTYDQITSSYTLTFTQEGND